jgi:hypothetical protein
MLSLPKESPPPQKDGTGQKIPITNWHWLVKKHPVEFSKNNHTPPPTTHNNEQPATGQPLKPT